VCYTPFVDLPAIPESVRSSLTAEVAREIATAYTDQVIFPDNVVIDLPEADNRRFPGWPGPVLVICVENQGVCAWGVPLGHQNPAVLVGGDIYDRTGWIRGTTAYCSDVAAFVAARRWDASCLSQGLLLQAQAAELDGATLGELRRQFEQRPPTMGWPGHTVHRLERRGVKIMLWDGPGQCDWWISAADVTTLKATAAAVLPLSDLCTSLWSTDPEGTALLRQIRGRG
jgi:hypothetical protein